MAELLRNKRWQTVVSLLTIGYFVYVIAWLTPESEPRSRIIKPMEFFWNYWRLDQNWRLFSPEIRGISYHTSCRLTFEDGTNANYELPQNLRLSMAERFRTEKWRKWGIDSLPWPDYKQFWPDFARFVGRRFYREDNKPVSMSFYLHWADMYPPADRSRSDLEYHYKISPIFMYRYTPEDFR